MKLGLISDVHGDPTALELAWSHLITMGADRIVCAGDLVGYGPFPDQVVAFVRDREIACVHGNHDRWAVERGLGARDEFGGGLPSRATLDFLTALPFDLRFEEDGKTIEVVHGSTRDYMEFVTRDRHPPRALRGMLDETRADVLVCGHTHDPMFCRVGAGLVVNPGSVVSVPSARTKTSRTFALLDLETLAVSHHDVESGEPVAIAAWSEDVGPGGGA